MRFLFCNESIAVADGVSKAKQSHYGATVVCRYALEWAMRSLAEDQSINWDELSHGAAWALVEFGHTHLGLPREAAAAEKALATTLSVAIVRPDERGATATVVAMGDSGVWLLEAARYDSLAGRKAEEGGLVSNLVTALPRVPDRLEPATVHISEDQVFLVGTDGFGDPLGSGKGLVGQLFAAELAEPPYPLRFAHILDFSRETFDDDRTLIAIWPFGRDRSNTISDRGTVGATGRERGLNLRVNDQ